MLGWGDPEQLLLDDDFNSVAAEVDISIPVGKDLACSEVIFVNTCSISC